MPSSASPQQSINGPPPVRPETEGAWGDKDKQDADKSLSPSKLLVLNGGDQASRTSPNPSPQVRQQSQSLLILPYKGTVYFIVHLIYHL